MFSSSALQGVILVVAAVVLPALAAEQVWRTKPAAEWTVEEALKVVRESEWAHEEHVLYPSRAQVYSRRERYGVWREPDLYFGNWGSYLVRWESAEVVRQAFARLEELGAGASAQFQAPPPRQPIDRHVVTVKTTRPPPRGIDILTRLSNRQLLANTELRTVGGAVAPVEVERSGMGATAAVHFFFPRTLEGQPVVGSYPQQVEFHLEVRRFHLKSKFRVSN
jgi:hypothetical protein